MIVDRDEEHDFKIGNGEVYSLCAWSSNGGFSTLFIYFRPMVLHKALNPSQCKMNMNDSEFTLTDICPVLDIGNITASINGYNLKNISLQKIYETGGGHAMPAYILQTQRMPEGGGYTAVGKQTLVVEYNAKDENGNLSQSQGRLQFFYNNAFMLAFR